MSYTGQNRAKIDGIKILLVGDVPDAHLVLRAMTFTSNPALTHFKSPYFKILITALNNTNTL